jgi:hypothetical protein
VTELTHGLNHIKWMSRTQGERFLRCRQAGHECAFRFQAEYSPRSRKRIKTDRPFVCGFISIGTRCKKNGKQTQEHKVRT